MATLEPTTYQPPQPSLRVRLRKYAKILRVSLSERLVYRADFFISTFMRFLPMLTTILLWHAVYMGAARGNVSDAQNITLGSEERHFRLNEMVSYLLLVNISRMFSSMPGLARGIATDIREGTLKKYLLQPIDMVSYLVTYRVAHKTAYIMMSSIPYAILFWLCRSYLPGWPEPHVFAYYVSALLLGFVIGFFFEASIGMIGFWFLEVTSFLYVIMTLTFFFSGHMFPLDLLPEFWAGILKLLPFNYLAYYPAMIFLGKIPEDELFSGLMVELAWAIGLIVLCRFLFYRGLRRYSAYGG